MCYSSCYSQRRRTTVRPVESARDRAVITVSQLSLAAHDDAICHSGYYQLQQLRHDIRSLTGNVVKNTVITCRLDYCNSLLYGVSNNQSVQNAAAAAACLVTGTRRCEHITPVLQKLHWLPIRRRVQFKLTCLVYQLLAGQTLTYLTSDIQFTADTGCPQLRSASERIAYVLFHTHTQQLQWQKFLCCRSSCVEHLAIISVAGHEL